MYALLDTFNEKIVSKHRTLKGMAKAKDTLLKRIKKAHGESCYLPLVPRRIASGGNLEELSEVEVDDFFHEENKVC